MFQGVSVDHERLPVRMRNLPARALELYDKSIDLLRSADAQYLLADGQHDDARDCFQKSLEIFGEYFEGWDIAITLAYLADATLFAGDEAEAKALYLDSMRHARRIDSAPLMLMALAGLAQLEMRFNPDLATGWLTKQEQYRLLREAERQISAANTELRRRHAVRNRAFLVFLLNTGLRVSEACALQDADVQVGERSGWVVVRSGKGNKSRRVPLNAEARHALKTWHDVRGEDGGRLWTLSVRRAQSILSELGRRAGVEIHPHTLRHTLAKNLVDAGVGLPAVAALLGHSSLNTTRLYITPGERDLEQVMKALEF
jgi:integrase